MRPAPIPDELDLLWFFESEPIAATPEDGFWRYEGRDPTGTAVRVGIHVIEGSVQTDLIVAGREVQTVCFEGLSSLIIDNGLLIGRFDMNTFRGALELRLKPEISVRWYTLKVA